MNTFRKEERLCSKKHIDLLFKSGSSFLFYPYRITFLKAGDTPFPAHFPVQVLINVAKKRYKRAVDRNLLKRRMREAYRIHKQHILYKELSPADGLLLVAIHYVGKEKYAFSFMEKKMQQALQRLLKQSRTDENH